MSYDISDLVWGLPMRPSSVKYVLLNLSMRSNKHGESWPSVPRISEDTGLNKKTVMTAVAALEEMNLLTVERNRGAGNRYLINLEALSESSTDIGSTYIGSPLTPKTGVDHYQKREPNKSLTSKEEVSSPPARKSKPKKRTVPDDFVLTDEHRDWAEKNGYRNIQDHFNYFKDAAKAKGYEYADWNRAFYNAVRSDWAKLNQGLHRKTTKVAGVYAA